MWAEGVESGLDPYLPVETVHSNISTLTRGWRDELSGLMMWLDWSVWIKCIPACGFEVCVIATSII
ncbi:hypothetical protein BV22DRAFT_1035404 [Leucogyrophana mollusca]|uniref:Uncharacterized protein n=1 Tax=Leucogyrophana mollusca TaxID=85980 RepID=A0ACB8BF83_9AGAM|nr:hypothetical protein BV22DRAFT_1035404 [Leucogyrophana mollusca]